jgi:hypothetical protein
MSTDTIDKAQLLMQVVPAAFYRPNKPAPLDWILRQGGSPGSKSTGDRPWFESDAQTRVAIGGNRAGKTTKLVLEVGSFALGFRPWYTKDDPWFTRGLFTPARKARGYARIRYVLPSLSQHLAEVMEQFKIWWPKDWYRVTEWDTDRRPRAIEFFNGSKITFMSHHMDVEDFEGIEADLNAFDEPPPERIWTGLTRGVVSTGGKNIVGCTLLDASGWFWEKIVNQAEDSEDAILITWHSIWDNAAENGGCPHQSCENIRNWMRMIADPDERQAREHGHPMHIGGLVLSGYKNKINTVDPITFPEGAVIVSGIDPAGSRPFAVLWVAYFSNPAFPGGWEGHLFDELWMPGMKNDLGAFAEAWEQRERGDVDPCFPHHPSRSVFTVIDPFANEPQKADEFGRTMRRILDEDYGIVTMCANRSGKRARLMQFNSRFISGNYRAWNTLQRFHTERKQWTWDQDKKKLTRGADDVCDCGTYVDATNPFEMVTSGNPDGIYRRSFYESEDDQKLLEKWRATKELRRPSHVRFSDLHG